MKISGVLEGLGSFGDLVALIFTNPGTSRTPWCRLMFQIGGIIFPSTVSAVNKPAPCNKAPPTKQIHSHTHIHTCMYVCMCMCMCMCICMYLCMCTYIYIYVHVISHDYIFHVLSGCLGSGWAEGYLRKVKVGKPQTLCKIQHIHIKPCNRSLVKPVKSLLESTRNNT